MKNSITRRRFLQASSAVAAGFCVTGFAATPPRRVLTANDKLNIGVIGVSGRGGDNLKEVGALENIVALCDVDAGRLTGAAKLFPGAKTYADFRQLIDQPDIDAIVVSTPDHTHAVATAAALQSGRHVYCEKPLTHTVSEARIITELAARYKAVTQIGTQIHAGRNYRRVVELVQSGAVGPIREVHVWVAATYGGSALPAERPPVPPELNWELWLGPQPFQPYHPDIAHFKWRNWWAFGGGALADFGCHFMDLPFWALGLKYPLTIEPVDGPPVHADSPPPWMIVRYEFPAGDGKAPTAGSTIPLTWYHGGKQPSLLSDELKKNWKSGVLFVGENGTLLSDYGRHVLLPEDRFKDFKRPEPFIPDSIGHHKEWTQAIKTDGKTTCPFSYSGPLTETALLGNVAYRVGQKLEWDAARLRARNCPQADQFIQHHYREGWRI